MPIDLDPLAGPKGGDKGRRLAAFWIDQINTIRDNVAYKQFVKRGIKIEQRYRDDRTRSEEDGIRRYNSLWSNVEILKPALYGRMPVPVADRQFKDKDPAGRFAASILERSLRNEINICGYDDALRRAVGDYLLPGRGTVWVRYEPKIAESVSLPSEPQTDISDSQGTINDIGSNASVMTPGGRMRPLIDDSAPEGPDPEQAQPDAGEEVEKLESTGDRVVRESTPVDFVAWTDFFIFPARARTWAEVTGVGKRVFMSRDQMKKRFGDEIGKAIPLEKDDRAQRDRSSDFDGPEQDKGQIFEIWSKDDLTVYWVSLGYRFLCDKKDDPLKLERFFPTPCPLFANSTNNTLVPVADYIQYQDQAIQIDELTQRLSMLVKACKIAGVYNAAAKDIQRLFSESVENQLIPVDDWAAFAEKGGVEGNISLMPVKEIMGVIQELMVVKQKLIEEMDRLTGINDIMRGTSDARETLGGVRLKTNATGTRLTSRQNEVARMARETVRIMADIMCQHFSMQSLIEASGALFEEGLGPDDMPPLSDLQSPPPAPPKALPGPSPMMGHNGGPPMEGAAPAPGPQAPPPPQQPPMGQPPGQPGPMPPPTPPMGGAPPQMSPPGGNVVPFNRPGAPPPPAMPPAGPQMPAGEVLPPEVVAKLAAFQRISSALQVIRNEQIRGFRVDIEVDSTIFPDMAQDQEDRTKFITAVTQFLQQSLMIGAQAPEVIPLLAKLLQFGVRGFKIGRDLETAIDEFAEKAGDMAKRRMQEAATNPSPEQIKAQSQERTAAMKATSDTQRSAAEIRRQELENEGEQANNAAEDRNKQWDFKMKEVDERMEQMKVQMEQIKAMAAKSAPKPAANTGA